MALFSSPYPDACSKVGLAARNGNLEQLRKLISDGADIYVKDNRGWYPMHEAADAGHGECVELLLQAASEDCDTNEMLLYFFPPAFDGSTPLSLAASKGHTQVVKTLTPFYIEISAELASYPLHRACQANSLCCVEILANALPHLINCQDKLTGLYPLHIAVENRNIEIVKDLLHAGALPDVSDFDQKVTPLHASVTVGNLEITKILLSANCNVNAVDSKNCTALYLAAQSGTSNFVDVLLSNGANPNIGMKLSKDFLSFGSDIKYSSPLAAAAANGHLNVLKQLIGLTPSSDGVLAVLLSAVNRENECLEFLLSAGIPTISSLSQDDRFIAWDCILSNESFFNERNLLSTIRILLDHDTTFQDVIGRKDFLSFSRCCNLHSEQLLQVDVFEIFLEAGLAELQFGCSPHPKISDSVIEHYSVFIDQLNMSAGQATYSTVQSILQRFSVYLNYFPFVSCEFCHPMCDSPRSKEKSLKIIVPKLQNLCRWTIRCRVMKKFGVVNLKNIKKFNLPYIINSFLLHQ